MSGSYGAVPMSGLGVPGSPGFSSASPNSSPYGREYSLRFFLNIVICANRIANSE